MAKTDAITPPKPSRQAATVPATVPENFFGPAPLIPGEDPADYKALLGRISTAIQPRGTLEEIWVRDVADLTWETLRWRRLKASLLQAKSHEGVSKILNPLVGYSRAEKLSEGWARGNSKEKAEISARLTAAGLTVDAVMALTLDQKLDEVERIDRLIASAEARRNNALREIDRHRAALGAAVRAAVEDVEDAEFTDVGTAQTAGETQ